MKRNVLLNCFHCACMFVWQKKREGYLLMLYARIVTIRTKNKKELPIFAGVKKPEGETFNKLIVFDEAHKYITHSDLTSHVVTEIREMRHKGVTLLLASQDPPSLPNEVIELSSVIILHRFNSPKWLSHIQKSSIALKELTPTQLSQLQPGEAFLWANKATNAEWTKKAIKIITRPRVTQHGGGTQKAVD